MTRSSRTLLAGALGLVTVALVIALTGGGDDPTSSPGPASTTLGAPDTPATTSSSTTSSSTSTSTTTTTLDPRFVESTDRISALIERSTPEEIAYRLVVTGLTGSNLDSRLDGTVGSRCVGGVFLTESNNNWAPADDPDAFRAARSVIDDDRWIDECDFLPLITTDAELGAVVRVPVESPAAAPDWADRYVTGEPYNVLLDIQEQSLAYADALHDLGVDVNFGAVADVATSPDHFMARQGRTFGDDPGIVAALANAVVSGHCEAGVAATLKHFPNQGATIEDPHRERSTAIGGVDLWETTGRLPYEGTEAPLVMTGHIFMNDIDAEMPASLSETITGKLLRGELGYDGVVITDDLSTMRGASDVIPDAGDRAVAAISAGADLVLFVDDRDIPRVIEALAAEMEADPDVFMPRAQSALRRVLRLHLGLTDPDLFPLCREQG
jgi:beta-N-acetylhexosaminidase